MLISHQQTADSLEPCKFFFFFSFLNKKYNVAKPPLQQLKQESLVQNMNQRPVTQGIETGSMAFDKSMPEMADRPVTTAGA